MNKKRPPEDYVIALFMRKEGNTFAEIGHKLGVSGSRAAQIFRRAQRIRDCARSPDERDDESVYGQVHRMMIAQGLK